MALPDLTGINIENSYQRVVHTDGTLYYDGTGSLLNLGPINTGSFATTGSNTFIGSQTITGSVNTSGSLNVDNTLYVSGGRIGIGTNTLAAGSALNISSAAQSNIQLIDTTNNASLNLGVGNFDASISSNGRLFLQSSTTLSVSSTNVGIGIASPTLAKLHVVGNVLFSGGSTTIRGAGTTSSTTAFLVQNSTPTSLFSILDNGNVGIGTTSPTATLDVLGSVRVTNNAVITGSLIVVETTGNPRLDTSNGVLYRLGVTSVDWRTRTLNNDAASVILDWNNNQIYDTTGNSSIDWENRVLWDLTGGVASIDYGRRELYNSTGDITLDYDTGVLTGTASFASTATTAQTASYVNPLNQDVQITGSLSVSGSVVINNVDIQSTIIAMAIALG